MAFIDSEALTQVIEREEIRVDIPLPFDQLPLWLDSQYWLGRAVPFLILTKITPGIVMIHARLVQYREAYDIDFPSE